MDARKAFQEPSLKRESPVTQNSGKGICLVLIAFETARSDATAPLQGLPDFSLYNIPILGIEFDQI
jgi:hypothetical protein